MSANIPIILVRGGGDLASGVVLRLQRAGLKVLITELPRPLMVRRLVSFAEAVYRGEFSVEGVCARRVEKAADVTRSLLVGEIPVLVDPDGEIFVRAQFNLRAVVDARMLKRPPEMHMPSGQPWREAAPLLIGLGPGFVAGENCHAVIETNRGHYLGRVIWQGAPQEDTGVPGKVVHFSAERVLRAPVGGTLLAHGALGEIIRQGEVIADVDGVSIVAPFDGVLRGLLHDGLRVHQGMKVGDLDPRLDPRYASLVSEKSLAIGGGVLEALLTRSEVRATLWP